MSRRAMGAIGLAAQKLARRRAPTAMDVPAFAASWAHLIAGANPIKH